MLVRVGSGKVTLTESPPTGTVGCCPQLDSVGTVAISAVIFDLDDTLIQEEDTARASYHEVARRLSVENPEGWRVIRDAVRAVWRGGPHYDPCLSLGVASWEGLWATFEGNHPILDGVRSWAPEYRRDAWTTAGRPGTRRS